MDNVTSEGDGTLRVNRFGYVSGLELWKRLGKRLVTDVDILAMLSRVFAAVS